MIIDGEIKVDSAKTQDMAITEAKEYKVKE
jgi:hypothetical protein